MAGYRPVSFSSASAPGMSKFEIDTFLGADLTNSPANVENTRSPDCENMIRDVPGKVRKRMGWRTVLELEGAVNGFHTCRDGAPLIHAGTRLYRMTLGEAGAWMAEELAGGLADGRSRSWLLADQLVIADGGTLWIYDGERVKPASEGAYVPTLTIGKGPKAGGQEYEGINLIQPKFTEQFLGTAADKAYQLSLAPLDAAAVTVELLQSDGSWRELAEGSDFSVDRTAGLVTFTAAPGVSPVSGQDNVKITAARTVEGYADRIDRCDIGPCSG